MKYVKRIVVFASLALIATAFVAIALPLAALYLFGLRRFASNVLYALARWWANRIIQMSGSVVHRAGTEHIPQSGPVCFVSNHSGIFDIVLCLSAIGRPFGFIAKKELALIPFLNLWILLLGGLFIERNNPRKALKTISDAAGHVKKGGAMIIFPEGTRSKGRGLLPFKPGAMKLAVESGAPIVPVAISGSYDVFERTGFIEKVNVSISFGQAIDQSTLPHEHKRQALSDA
ncbi:MAG: 1-acylglycerol-3-phosphate O-acyltransferase, partial [Spirochaetaceae bacterium]|nr:1-acylglycerol-3-phosphate O-acyltransferase [Spirochaetaceae bacterium]